jgi:hypothetical protein
MYRTVHIQYLFGDMEGRRLQYSIILGNLLRSTNVVCVLYSIFSVLFYYPPKKSSIQQRRTTLNFNSDGVGLAISGSVDV